MRHLFILCLAAVFISGCGSEPVYIVEKFQLRIFFKEKSAELRFHFNEEYPTGSKSTSYFPGLALSELQESELYIYSFISPKILEADWPWVSLPTLPSGQSLPKKLRKNDFKAWRQDGLSLVLDDNEDLLLGGIFQSPSFDELPPGFLAVQEIKSDGGSLRASIALFGPGRTEQGGVLAIGHLGVNPFESSDPDSNVLEFEFPATEGAQLLSLGKSSIWNWFEF